MAFSRSLAAADTVVLLPAIAFSFLLKAILSIQGAGYRSGDCRSSLPPCVPPSLYELPTPSRGGKLPVASFDREKGKNVTITRHDASRFPCPILTQGQETGKRLSQPDLLQV